MKKLLVMGAALFAVAQYSSAASCTNGTLASYLALGSGGCTISGETLSNFQVLTGIFGATPIATSGVNVSLSGGGYTPTFTFTTNQTASKGGLLESIFTYKISGGSFTSSGISLSGSSETVDGGVTAIENYCAGGSFGPDGVSGCTGKTNSLLTLDGIQNSNSSLLGPVSLLSVTDDFTLSGGLLGSATGGVFTNSFTATPEPASILFTGLGLVLAAGAGIRRSRTFFKK